MSSIASRLLALSLFCLSTTVQAFGLADVALRAERLAEDRYREAQDDLPRDLRDLNYDQYRDIVFNPAKAVWHAQKLPFELQLFHPGLYFRHPVKINLVRGGVSRPLGFNPAFFNYGRNKLDTSQFRDLGYAGFRVHFALNKKSFKDELLVFQGASYFRGVGAGQRYGLSARGLAVDTAVASGEEFPAFREFWVETPAPVARELVIYALLDSRRVTGAFRFKLQPGSRTVVDVTSRLFLREPVDKLGLAPLTSMFYRGSNQYRGGDDYRPEVHDSDGLLVANGNGEWIWRPLVNPRRLLVSSFGLNNPRGFGLMQRRRTFDAYEDLEARYDLRPSAWVEPAGNWGAGRVELVQIPTPDETNDNIVAYWLPKELPEPGKAINLAYRLSWQNASPVPKQVASVLQTRRGHGYVKEDDDSMRLLVDFAAPPADRGPTRTPITGVLWLDDNATLIEQQTYPNEVTGGWRMSLRFKRIDDSKPVEMRASLLRGQAQVSESWSYILPGE